MTIPGGLRSCTFTTFSPRIFFNSTLVPPNTSGNRSDVIFVTFLLIGSYGFCIVPLLAVFISRPKYQHFKTAVASSSQAGDGPRKRLLSAHTSSVRAQAAKLEVQKNASSVKTPNRGTNRDSTVPGSKTLPRTGSWCARQVGSSTYNQLRADKSRLRSSSTQRPVFRTFRSQTPAPPDLLVSEKKPSGLVHYKTKCDEQVKWIAQLKELLKTSNQRFEGVAIVVQYLQARREEGNKQHKELSQELLNLQGELETRRQTCDKLDREREELEKNYQGVIQKLSEEHQTELRELEERLQQLFTAEQERLQQVLNDDLGKLQTQWQEQVEDINSKHETHKLGLITSHIKKLESLTEDYEQSLAELTRSYELEKHSLEETFNQTQSQLQEQISKLNEENNSLKEKVKAKEQVTKTHVQQDQKISPQSLYLEQELESLKAVLEIRNEKIHEQEKKLMKMEKLMEKHVELDEKFNLVSQENEDLKARMDRHVALSRQLSTEQAVLQQSLHKESKVNKRLSMENEELLWKLHNGDVLSPKKTSPNSPTISFQPSRNSVSPSSSHATSPR
uniref:Microtubule-associated tumor suppressor 1-like protein n=1 Tax=Callorhinchus milii TaxID=7868 RepID=A0A4W3IPH2_CALMI